LRSARFDTAQPYARARIWLRGFYGEEITASVVGAIEPKLRKAEIERAQRKPTEKLHAYDLFLRAADYGRLVRLSSQDTEAAVGLLRLAVNLDPGFANHISPVMTVPNSCFCRNPWTTTSALRTRCALSKPSSRGWTCPHQDMSVETTCTAKPGTGSRNPPSVRRDTDGSSPSCFFTLVRRLFSSVLRTGQQQGLDDAR
jgi:hypothetical protein